MNDKYILITGGAGFIGSHLIDLFIKEKISFMALDNLSSGSLSNIPDAVSRGYFIRGDVKDKNLMESLISKSSLVIHLASVVGVKNVMMDPLETIETNINSVKFIAESCSTKNIPLIFFSSSLVYPNSNGRIQSFSEDNETHGLGFHPVSVYVSSKKIGELICEHYKKQNGLRYVIIRPFNIIGIRQDDSSGMVVPSFIISALTNNCLNVFGSGQQSRTFSDVKMAVKLLWSIIQDEKSYGQIFNLATTDKSITILELARVIKKLLDEPVKINFIPMQDVYGSAYKDVENRSPSLTKLRQSLDYWEETDLEKILSEIIEFEKQKMNMN